MKRIYACGPLPRRRRVRNHPVVDMLHEKIEKKAKLLPINIVLGTGLVMVAWALADVAHTTTLMPLFPAGIFPLPDSDIIAIVFYHVALGIGIAWAV